MNGMYFWTTAHSAGVEGKKVEKSGEEREFLSVKIQPFSKVRFPHSKFTSK